jgi:Cu(I)/Ag(I) efflux system membrane protein CusA/SilA
VRRWPSARSPDIIEDQVTYPIITSLLGAPKVKAIRGFSDFGFSYVYVIFENELNAALQLPGISNAWTMPIKGRLDMLSTGIRTPIGIKVSGADLGTIERLAQETQAVIKKLPGTRSVYAERVAGGYFLDFVLKRDELARYGLSVDDANMMVMTAVGGDNQSVTVEGRERYGINVRYAREYREDLASLRRVLLPLPNGEGQIPMPPSSLYHPK